MYVYIHVYIHIYIYMYIYVYVLYIHIKYYQYDITLHYSIVAHTQQWCNFKLEQRFAQAWGKGRKG